MNDMTLRLADEATVQRLTDTLALQRKAYFDHPVPSLEERKADLRTLLRFVRSTTTRSARRSAPTTATARGTRRCWPRSCRWSTTSRTRSGI